MPKRVLTIAGSDSLSGGGIQADLATFVEHGVFGFTALTSIVTVVEDKFLIHEIDLEIVREQLQTIFSLPEITGIKIGLLPSVEVIKLVGKFLEEYQDLIIVADPVMAFKETDDVRMEEIREAMREYVFPYADIVTPNLIEAKLLAEVDEEITTIDEMKEVAEKISLFGSKYVVVKGGKRIEGTDAVDVLFDGENFYIMHATKIENNLNNGAGCTFASAICANLVNGQPIIEAVENAKHFVHQSIENGIFLTDDFGNVWVGRKR